MPILRPDVRLMRMLGCSQFVQVIAVAMFIGFSIVNFPSQASTLEKDLDDDIKADFLYKFNAYVDWPVTAFTSPTSPFSICLVGSSDLFNSTLEKVVNGESVHGHPVVVRRISTMENEVGCHVLYIDASNATRITQWINAARDTFTLTVTDGASQGIIDFLKTDDRVSFNIDDEAAAKKELVIDSKLLSLAVNVKRRIPKGE